MEVAASNNQFRLSIPLVSPAGQMNTELFVDAYKTASQLCTDKCVVQIDDLDNIDEILSNMFGDGLLEDSLWD